MTADDLLREARFALERVPNMQVNETTTKRLATKIQQYLHPHPTEPPKMEFRMIHGRSSPDEELNWWGFDGPVLKGVSWVACTYNVHWRICFESKEDFDFAKEATGWEEWDENQLLLKFYDDMLEARDANGKPAWYGDWSIDPSRDY